MEIPVLETKQSQISCTETGTEEPVVLIHCSSASGSEWNGLSEEQRNRVHCVMPDQRSCGRSDPWPGDGLSTLVDEAGVARRLGSIEGIQKTDTMLACKAYSRQSVRCIQNLIYLSDSPDNPLNYWKYPSDIFPRIAALVGDLATKAVAPHTSFWNTFTGRWHHRNNRKR